MLTTMSPFEAPMNNCETILDVVRPVLSCFGEVVIAGGAVRDELMQRKPKDYDVFILCDGDWNWDDIKQDVSNELLRFKLAPQSVEWHKSEPFLVQNIDLDGDSVQIMASPQRSMKQLVDTFDWSVARFATDGKSYEKQASIEAIKPGGELELHRVTYPMSTLRRGFRFSERFTMKFRKADIVRLCATIAAEDQVNSAIKKLDEFKGQTHD